MLPPRLVKIARGYDILSHIYAPLVYLGGKVVWRAQNRLIDQVGQAGKALFVGEGSGHFLTAFAKARPRFSLTYLDISPRMTQKARKRWYTLKGAVGNHPPVFLTISLEQFLEEVKGAPHSSRAERFDVIALNFFLDQYPNKEAAEIAKELEAILSADGFFYFTDFVSSKGCFNRLLIAALYALFRKTTHIQAESLPNYEAAFLAAGLIKSQERWSPFGIQTAIWQKRG